MLSEHGGVQFRIFMIVVPVHHIDIRQRINDALWDMGIHVIILIVLGAEPEEHIRPHHGMEIILLADFTDPGKMAGKQFEAVHHTMLLQVTSETDAVCFIHADMNLVGPEAGTQGTQHGINELIGFLTVDHQNGILVAELPVCIPAQECTQVRQRLDAGNQLNAGVSGVCINLAQLCLGITSSA